MDKKILVLSIAVIAVFGTSGLMLFSEQTLTQNENQTVDQMKGTLKNYSVEELAAGTPYAIVGEVKQITPILVDTEIGERVFSDVTIQVQQDLNNKYSEKEIIVRVLGGEVETRKTISHFSPTFEQNEKVLFFVAEKEPNSIYGDNYYVAGLSVGKYSIQQDIAVKSSSGESTDLSEIVSKIQKVKE